MNPHQLAYAGLVSRGAAFFVDAAIVVTLVIGLVGAVEIITFAVGVSPHALAPLTPALLAAPPVVFVVYDTVCWTLTGRTAGMALFGVRLIRTRARPMTWVVAFVRAVAQALLLWGIVWSLVDRRRQALYDKIAGTVVIYYPAPVAGSPAVGEPRRLDSVPVLPPP